MSDQICFSDQILGTDPKSNYSKNTFQLNSSEFTKRTGTDAYKVLSCCQTERTESDFTPNKLIQKGNDIIVSAFQSNEQSKEPLCEIITEEDEIEIFDAPKYFDKIVFQNEFRGQIIKPSERVNGFQCTPSVHQVITWVFYGYNLVTHFIIWHKNQAYEILFSFQLLLDMLVFLYGYLTTKADPTDRIVRLDRYCHLTKQSFDQDKYEFFCHICEAHVMEFTKHCGRCQRCTAEFDHHCVWLNNCVGKENYRLFFKLIVIVLFDTLFSVGIDVYFYILNENIEALVQGILNSIVAIAVGYLIIYHIWLYFSGKTTYQHIVEQRIKKSNKEKEKYLQQIQKNQRSSIVVRQQVVLHEYIPTSESEDHHIKQNIMEIAPQQERTQSMQSELKQSLEFLEKRNLNPTKTFGEKKGWLANQKQGYLTNSTIEEHKHNQSYEIKKKPKTVRDDIISALVSTESVIPGIFEPQQKVWVPNPSQYDNQEFESVLNQTLQHARCSIVFVKNQSNNNMKNSVEYENPQLQQILQSLISETGLNRVKSKTIKKKKQLK